jgi:Glutaredoxin
VLCNNRCTSTLAASCELSVTAVTQEFDADANSHITPLRAPIVLFICVQLVSSKPVMLFMKGNPAEPRCGFSRTIVALLQEQGFEFSTFDILQVLELVLLCMCKNGQEESSAVVMFVRALPDSALNGAQQCVCHSC